MISQYRKWNIALKTAFPLTIPVFAGYWFLGLTYGVLMNKNGFCFVWPMLMAMWIYSGSVEFVAVRILLSAFNPIQAFLISLMIGARHVFYSISMLDKFRHTGWKKPFLIYMMSDETFSVNYTARIPKDVDSGCFMFWVSILDFLYWVTGAAVGGLLGVFITFSTQGLDFVMTSMFVVIFTEQWLKDKNHIPAIFGVALSLISLLVFGPDRFVIPAMAGMMVVFIALRPRLEKSGISENMTGERKGGKSL